MKKKIVPFILPFLILVVLFILLFYQHAWLRIIKNTEIKRLQNEVVLCAKNTIILLENEVSFFSDIVQNFVNEDEDLVTQLSNSIEYWNINAIDRNLVNDVYFFTNTDFSDIKKIYNQMLLDLTKDELSFIHESFGFSFYYRVENDSVYYFPTDSYYDLIVFTLIHDGKKYFMVYTINKDVLVNNTLPLLVKYCFNQSDDYFYRVFDLTKQQELYNSCQENNENLFLYPDFVWDLYSDEKDWEHESYAVIKRRKDNILRDFSTFYNETDLSRKESLKQYVSFDSIQPKWVTKRHILLQIVHKEGSLMKAAQETTLTNTSISLSVFFLLVICILMMYINMRKAEKLAFKQKEFIATTTHELKTPLTVISLAAQNMEAGIVKSTKTINSYGKMIKKESDRLQKTIDFLLVYSRINSQKKDNFKVLNINELLKEVIFKYKNILENEKFTLVFEESNVPILVFCDEYAIQSVIQNLIDNAIKHASVGKYLKIEVKVNAKKSNVKILFTDKGPGIQRKDQKRIFEAFERGSEASKKQIQGMGIGLNIAKRMIISNGGAIQLESSCSSGSVFVIQLPIYFSDIKTISENQ